MDFELRYKPGWDPVAVEAVRASVKRPSASALHLRYVVEGRIGEIVVAEPGQAVRRNDLWQTTCFELFLRRPAGEAYLEFNFSPSGAWAAFDFAAYRAGMVQAALVAPPEILVTRGAARLELDVGLALDLGDSHMVGIAAVIEESGGRKSYWALNHPNGAPDFHHPCCFDAELPPPAAA